MKLPISGIPILPPDVIAPEKQVLRYISHPKFYAIPPDAQPIEGEFEGLVLRERHEPGQQKTRMPGNLGKYTITIEAPIGSSGELLSIGSKIREMAEDLDKFWAYACGEPLNPTVIQLSFQRTPIGWESNVDLVTQYLVANCRKRYFTVKPGEHRHEISMPYFPLLHALRARDECQKADPQMQALVDIHYSALKSRPGEGKLFFFARALELAREFMPGKKNAEKQKSIHPAIQAELKQSLDWLFNISNNRYNTRHVVVKNQPSAILHPKMTGKEFVEFEHDANLVVLGVICDRFGISPTPLRPWKS